MIMDKFNEAEQIEILEMARVALSDADTFDIIGDHLDLSDDYIKALQEKIIITLDFSIE